VEVRDSIPVIAGASTGAQKERSLLVTPEELILLLLAMDDRVRDGATQRRIAWVSLLSQPTVSRLLKSLTARGWTKTFLPGPWERRNPERFYHLTPSGGVRAQEIWNRLREFPSPEPPLRALDVIDLNPTIPPVDLLLLCLRGDPFDVCHPRLELQVLEKERSGPIVLPPVTVPRGPEPPGGPQSIVPLVGRDRERKSILTALRRAVSSPSHPAVLSFLGPAGIGKTSLLDFARAAGVRRGFEVRSGHLVAWEKGPFYLFDELFGPAFREAEGAGSGKRRTLAERKLCLLRLLEKAATERPQLILVDDLHLVTVPTLAVLEFLLINIREKGLPVVLIFSGRNEGTSDEGSEKVLEWIHTFARRHSGLLALEQVQPLEPSEAHDLVLRSLDYPAADSLLAARLPQLEAKAHGNPLFLLEWVRDLRERGLPTGGEAPGLVEGELPVPETLVRLIDTRVSRLPGSEQTLLEMAATVGGTFDVDPLSEIATQGRWGNAVQVRRTLEDFVKRREFIERRGPHQYAFAHPLFQEVLGERNSGRVAWYLHLARWWGRHRPGEVERVAKLYYLAGDGAGALPWIRKAVARALKMEAWDLTEQYLKWLKETLGGSREALLVRAPLELEAAIEIRWGGAAAVAQRILAALSTEPLPPDLRWEVEVNLVASLTSTDPSQARSRLDTLWTTSGELPPLPWRGPLLVQRCWSALRQARPREGLRFAEGALRLAEGAEPGAYWVGLGRIAHASALFLLGRFEEALASSALFEEPRDLRARTSLMIQMSNLEGRIWLALGHPREARKCLLEGWEEAKSERRIATHTIVMSNLALAEIQLEHLPEAEKILRNCLELTRRFSLRLPHNWAIFRLGQLRFQQGFPEASRLFAEAEKGFRQMGMEGALRLSQIYRIVAEGMQGDPRTALRRLAPLKGKTSVIPAEERPPLDLLEARLWERAGNAKKSKDAIERALVRARKERRALFEGHAVASRARWLELHGSPATAQKERKAALRLLSKLGIKTMPEGDQLLPSPPKNAAA
jgi:tetratricopeptide (TPR) repeat protein/DNA-binding MarR family transcriptional regulator